MERWGNAPPSTMSWVYNDESLPIHSSILNAVTPIRTYWPLYCCLKRRNHGTQSRWVCVESSGSMSGCSGLHAEMEVRTERSRHHDLYISSSIHIHFTFTFYWRQPIEIIQLKQDRIHKKKHSTKKSSSELHSYLYILCQASPRSSISSQPPSPSRFDVHIVY